MKLYLGVALVASTISACSTVDVWKLDDPAADIHSVERLEKRIDRFLSASNVQGDPKDLYVVNGYYLLIQTPFIGRSDFRARIPYAICDGADNDEATEVESTCIRLDIPVSKKLN